MPRARPVGSLARAPHLRSVTPGVETCRKRVAELPEHHWGNYVDIHVDLLHRLHGFDPPEAAYGRERMLCTNAVDCR